MGDHQNLPLPQFPYTLKVILVKPSIEGNLGAIARNMLNFGFDELHLISPELTIGEEARKRAKHAKKVLEKAVIHNNVEDAINTLEFIEKSLSDVTNLIPPKITSDMSEIDTEAFGEDKLNDVLSVTKSMNVKKEDNEVIACGPRDGRRGAGRLWHGALAAVQL